MDTKKSRAGRPRTRIATPEVSTSDVCDFFGVTRETISEWTKNGMPKVATGAYHLKACFDWWCENINKDNDDETLTKAKRKYWTAKAEEMETKVAQTKGNLISKEEVVEQWCWRIGEFRQAMLSLPVRLPPILEGKPVREMRDIIQREAHGILEGYSREGKFCHAHALEENKKNVKRKAARK